MANVVCSLSGLHTRLTFALLLRQFNPTDFSGLHGRRKIQDEEGSRSSHHPQFDIVTDDVRV